MNWHLFSRRSGKSLLAAIWITMLATAAAGYAYLAFATPTVSPRTTVPEVEVPAIKAPATTEQVHEFCGKCHAYPPAESFPRFAWKKEVKQGYDFFRDSNLQMDYPSVESVLQYYEQRAPEELPPVVQETMPDPAPVRFERLGFHPPEQGPQPSVTNVNLVHLFDQRRLDVLVCQINPGRIQALSPYEKTPVWKDLAGPSTAKRWAPAHAEVVDLDGDGIPDIIVANLGVFHPTDDQVGSVVWLKGQGGGKYTPITLLDKVGRVADVQAADFNGDGKLDLIVGVFGWRNTGSIIYLENRTTDWSKPVFVPHEVDDRHGTIHVPVGDINGDGKPDFVALISQEHEIVEAFLNKGDGTFEKQTIYKASHPAYGSSGIQLVDLNKDGKLDVLYTNGDVLDRPYLLKPYHSVQWLENPGNGEFPFKHHHLTAMYGAMRAVAADFDGDGLLDVAAVSYLPGDAFPNREKLRLDAVVLLKQTEPGKFARYSVDKVQCDHFTCAAGDIYGDGKIHLVAGNFSLSRAHPIPDMITVWKNLGSQPAK